MFFHTFYFGGDSPTPPIFLLSSFLLRSSFLPYFSNTALGNIDFLKKRTILPFYFWCSLRHLKEQARAFAGQPETVSTLSNHLMLNSFDERM